MILALDTAGSWVAAAAGGPSTPLRTARRAAQLNHNEILQGLLDELSRPGDADRIELIAVNAGPGSFTGTRVGVAFAAGLATGLGLPLQTMTTFEVASDLAGEHERFAVAFPIVGDTWCRAQLQRKGRDLSELETLELDVLDVRRGLEGTTLVVPWGVLPAPTEEDSVGIVTPPSDWNPAAALLGAVQRSRRRGHRPGDARVRYLGPSQAEQNYRARRDRV